MEDYKTLIIRGIKEAAPQNQNVSKAFDGMTVQGQNPHGGKTQEEYDTGLWHRPGISSQQDTIKGYFCHACLARYPEEITRI